MASYYYSPQAIERLSNMAPSEKEKGAISMQLALLARKEISGYRIPFDPSLRDRFRFDVGRFKLIYRFKGEELEVVTIAD